MYLFSECVGYNFITKYKTKKPSSYSVIENSKGKIYFDEEGNLTITFTFKSQNEYGNFDISKCISNKIETIITE
jgi:hypothetical protein